MNKCFAFAGVLPLVLAACGGSGDGASTDVEDLTETERLALFDTYDSQFLDIESNYTFNDIEDIIDPSDLPATGTASYEGTMGFVPDSETALLGNMTLAVTFSTNTISGSADEFVDNAGNGYAGTLRMTDGILYRLTDLSTQYSYEAEIDGTLRGTQGDDYSVDAQVIGDFYGDDYEYAAGLVMGTLETPDGTVTMSGDNSFFATER